LGLTRLRASGSISKGIPDKVEVGIIGRADRLLVGMVAAMAAALHLAEMAGMLVLAAGTAEVVALVAGMVGTVAFPLVEMKGAGEEGAHLREGRETPQSPNGQTLQTEPLLTQNLEEILKVMTVRLIRMANLSFRPPILSTSIRTLGCCFSATSRHRSTASHPPTPATAATLCTPDGTTIGVGSWP
jgi:hypothetical protein